MAKVPTQDEVKRAILNVVAEYNIRPGEIVPLLGVSKKMQERGFRADEIKAALRAMEADGLIEPSNSLTQIKITEAGFAAI